MTTLTLHKECLLGIDVETSGPDMIRNFLVAIGACVVQVDGNRVCDEEDKFLVYLQPPPGTGWDPVCLADFWNSPRKSIDGKTQLQLLYESYAHHVTWSPKDAMNRFASWLHAMSFKYPRMVLITDTAGYDVAWLDYALQRFAHQKPFPSLAYCTGAYRTIRDVSSWYRGIGKQSAHQTMTEAEPSDILALKTLSHGNTTEFPDFKVQHTHNPLDDALLMTHKAVHITQLLDK